nr:hypothetical protein Iba_chr05cCG0720 [Ipomoea batatas]
MASPARTRQGYGDLGGVGEDTAVVGGDKRVSPTLAASSSLVDDNGGTQQRQMQPLLPSVRRPTGRV